MHAKHAALCVAAAGGGVVGILLCLGGLEFKETTEFGERRGGKGMGGA